MTALPEASMSKPLSEWLSNQGYEVYVEARSRYSLGLYDIVGKRDRFVVVIEMKTSLNKQVIHQAFRATLEADNIYCAIATQPKKTSLAQCEKHGLGVLRVVGGKVVVLLEPQLQSCSIYNWKGEFLERLNRMAPGGVAGKPCMKGIGPARTVHDAVVEYRRRKPDATWREMFHGIPNHYTSHLSMAGAMLILEKELAREGVGPEELVSKTTQKLARFFANQNKDKAV